jgi:glyoxylase-like metal-dependent hydrolase (beta-lactamase superfamily II)
VAARGTASQRTAAKELSIVSDSTPKVDVLLQGYSLDTNVGLAGFCMVTLVEGVDAAGQPKRLLFDPAMVGRRRVLWDALAKRGLGPRDIDGVVLSHSHWDHIQNIDVFDHAPIMIHPYERRYALKPHINDWATPAWTGAILERQQLVEVSEGDQLLQGVRVIDMPGHTPGGIGLAVETTNGLAVIAGDALHHGRVALLGENPLVFWDRKAAADTIARAVDMADLIYPGHDRVFRVTKDRKIEYLEEFQMTVYNVADRLDQLDWADMKPAQWIMPDIEQQQAAFAEFERAAAARRDQLPVPTEDGFVQWQQVEPAGPKQ